MIKIYICKVFEEKNLPKRFDKHIELIHSCNSHIYVCNWNTGSDFNPVKGDVSDSQLNAREGGHFYHPREIKEGVPSDPMLIKVILDP